MRAHFPCDTRPTRPMRSTRYLTAHGNPWRRSQRADRSPELSSPVREARISMRGRRIVAINPPENVPHGNIFLGGGVEERGEQRAGTFGPVLVAGARTAQPAGTDHGVRCHHCRVPIRRGRERRPADALDTGRTFHLAARIVEKRPPVAVARRCRRPHDIGLGRRRNDRALRGQNIGDDQGRCLPGARWPEDQCRALCAGPHPPVGALSNIDAIARQTVDLAQCARRNQARFGVVDMRMRVEFHTRDVCVGEHTIPWDISLNVATTTHGASRADAGWTAIARAKRSENNRRQRMQNDPANKECLTWACGQPRMCIPEA